MNYSISMVELLGRPIIRNDQPDEWMNKMTDDEIHQWEEEVYQILRKEKVPQQFPDINAGFLAKVIDRDILYRLYKDGVFEPPL